MRIPVGPDDLTPAWLTEALGGPPITDAGLTPVGTGQMCDSFRVRLRRDRPTPGVPATVVAKLPAADPLSRDTGRALRVYEAEVRFYQQLAPSLPIRTPAVHHADIEVETGAFVLLLEDLAPAQPGDQLAGCSPAQAIIAVDELVKLHAPRWGAPELQAMDWLVRDPDAGRATLHMIVPSAWDGFRARYGDRIDPTVHEAGDALVAGLDRFLEAPPDEHATVIHGDYRLDNLLFGPDDSLPVAVVDWQTVGRGRAVLDVSYFIGAGLLHDDRRQNEHALVRRYFDGLVAAGVTGYRWEDCWLDYRRGSLAGLLMAIAASMLVQQTDRGDQMFLTMAHRHAAHALDLDAPAVLSR